MMKFILTFISFFSFIGYVYSDGYTRITVSTDEFTTVANELNKHPDKQVTQFNINEDKELGIIVMNTGDAVYKYQAMCVDDEELDDYLTQYSPLGETKVVAWRVYDGDAYIIIANEQPKVVVKSPDIVISQERLLALARVQGAISEILKDQNLNSYDCGLAVKAQKRLYTALQEQNRLLSETILSASNGSSETLIQARPQTLKYLLEYARLKGKYETISQVNTHSDLKELYSKLSQQNQLLISMSKVQAELLTVLSKN